MRLISLPFSAYSKLCYILIFLLFISFQTLQAQSINTNLPGPQNIEYFGGNARPGPYGSVDWNWNTAAYVRSVFAGSTYSLPYRLYSPPVNGNQKYPLFIMLHGAGEAKGSQQVVGTSQADKDRDNNDIFQLKWGGRFSLDNQGSFPSYVLFPHVGQNWGNADVNNGFIYPNAMIGETSATFELIESLLATNPNIDPDRVYINGLSAGAYGTFEFLERRPDLFAGATTMSGMGDVNRAAAVATVPLWMFQGGKDDFPGQVLSKAMYDAIVAAGGNPIRTNNKDRDHWAWVDAYSYNSTKWLTWLYGRNKKNIIIKNGGIAQVCPGITTAGLAVSPGFAGYQWEKSVDGVTFSNIAGANSNEYQATAEGTYRVQFLRNGVWVISNPVNVIQNPTSTPKPATTAYYSPAIGNGEDVTLSGPTNINGQPLTYQWYKNGTPFSTSSQIKLFLTDKGAYTLQTKLQANCPSIASDPIYVVPSTVLPAIAAPSNLIVTATNISTVSLQWQDNSSNEDAFLIEYMGAQGAWFYSGYVSANVNTFTASNLKPNQDHWFRVRAVNMNGVSNYSGEASTTTLTDTEAPLAPTGLNVSNLLDQTLTLSWNQSSDNVGVTSYDIYRNNQLLGNTTNLAYNVTGLTGNTNYSFYVIAKDASNNVSPQSNLVTLKTAEIVNGTNYSYYTTTSGNPYNNVPNFSLLTPEIPTEGTDAYMDYFSLAGPGSSPAINKTSGDYFAFKFDAYLDVPVTGGYTFYLNSDDGSILYIDGLQVVNNDGLHGSNANGLGTSNTTPLNLTAGRHPIQVTFFEQTGSNVLTVKWTGPNGSGINQQEIPKARLFRIKTAGTYNTQPIADAGADVNIISPASTTILNGSGSDGDGFIQTYSWRYIPGSGPVTPTITGATTETLNISGLSQIGTYQFELTVTDNSGSTAIDVVSVIVKSANPIPVVAITNSPTTSIKIPVNSVALNGSITDNDAFTFVWNNISGPGAYTWANKTTFTPTLSDLVVGTYVISLIATDANGGIGGDTLSIVVQPSDVSSVSKLELLNLNESPNTKEGILTDGFLIDGGQFEPGGFSFTATTTPAQLTKLEWYIDGVLAYTNAASDGPPYIITNSQVAGEYLAAAPLVLSTGTHIIKAIPYVGATAGDALQVSVKIIEGPFRWDGGGVNTNWTTAANWDRDRVPAAEDNVRLDNSLKSGSYSVNFNIGAIPVESITIGSVGSSTTITLNAANPTITDGDGVDLTLNQGGKLSLSTNVEIGGDVVSNLGTIDAKSYDLKVNGSTSGTGGTLTNSGNLSSKVEYNGTGDKMVFAGSYEHLVINGTGNKILAGPVVATGTIELTAGTLVSNGNLTIDFAKGGISPDGAGAITGIVKARRTIDPGFHYLTSGLQNSTYGDFNSTIPLTGKNFQIYQESNPSPLAKDGWISTDYQQLSTLLSGNKYDGGPSDMTGYALNFRSRQTLNMTGMYNHSAASEFEAAGMSYTPSGEPSSDGWHLLGNPYPSYIDFTKCVLTNLNNSITFYDPSGGGRNIVYAPENLPFPSTDIGGATQYIGPMQAFWVQANASNASLKVPNSARTMSPVFPTGQEETLAKPFYRIAASDIKSLKISLSADGLKAYDETIVRFSSVTKDEFEPQYDTYKVMNDDNSPSIYSVLDNTLYSINSLPDAFSHKTIPLSIQVPASGTYKLKLKNSVGFDGATAVTLYDKVLNVSQNLLQNDLYEFSAEKAAAADRFYLNIVNAVTGNEDGNSSQIYVNQNGHEASIIFENINEDHASIYVSNSVGQHLITAEHAYIGNGSFPIHFGKGEHGVYIVQVVTANRKFSKKIIIK